jgi:hypothetical protein
MYVIFGGRNDRLGCATLLLAPSLLIQCSSVSRTVNLTRNCGDEGD